MMYISNFASHKRWTGNIPVAITLYPPQWHTGECAPELAPSKSLWRDYEAGKCSDEDYVLRYYSETLSKLDPHEIYRKYRGCVLLCFCAKGLFCHRLIVAEWLRTAGYEVIEI